MLTFHASHVLMLCLNDKIIALIRKLCSRKLLSYETKFVSDWSIAQGLSQSLNNTDLNKA